MPVLIGTDEAGYGPNLGPLVITATSWRLPDGMLPDEMWNALSDVVTDKPSRGDKRLHFGDSKKVYSSGKSIRSLERGVMAACWQLNLQTESVKTLGTSISNGDFAKDYADVCRGIVGELALPVASKTDDVRNASERFAEGLAEAKIDLLGVESCIMFPQEFNSKVAAVDSKGKVLSAATLNLVKNALAVSHAPSQGWVVCDKHGGRNRYSDVISATLGNTPVVALEESGPMSRYQMGDIELCFRTKAEEALPVALASMVAKYVREIVMMQFNSFWKHHIPELKPTKGYPMDAKRFWNDIAETAKRIGIEKSELWRNR